MKRKKKALLLASIASLCLLCGCGKNSQVEVVEKNGEEYIKTGDEYTKLDISPKRFEAGDHVVYYVVKRETGDSWLNVYEINSGYNGIKNIVPETPEGYKLIDVVSMSDANGATNAIAFFYVNEVPVLVEGVLNFETGIVEYVEPGVVVEEKTLEMGD